MIMVKKRIIEKQQKSPKKQQKKKEPSAKAKAVHSRIDSVSNRFHSKYNGVFDKEDTKGFFDSKKSPYIMGPRSGIEEDLLGYAKNAKSQRLVEQAKQNHPEGKIKPKQEKKINKGIDEEVKMIQDARSERTQTLQASRKMTDDYEARAAQKVDFSAPEFSTAAYEKNAEKYAASSYVNRAKNMEAMLKQKEIGEGTIDASKKFFGVDNVGTLDGILRNPEQRSQLYQKGMQERAEKLTMSDHLMGNKVPHIAGGLLGTAGLVSMMSSTKGQQSNAQLYGQQQPYY